jgi:hypothetical protein
MNLFRSSLIVAILLSSASLAWADTPVASYIFPAGGQRGTEVRVRVGGLYLHDGCPFVMGGPGVQADGRLNPIPTIWFEGPVIPLPDSQKAEDYPRDYSGRVTIAGDAAPGLRPWRVWTSQGATAARAFVVGELPEVVEEEIDGDPVPVRVTAPVTINGRIFPREDVDVWAFEAQAGQSITCAVDAGRLGSPLQAQLEILDPHGQRVAESSPAQSADALLRFTAREAGVYQARLYDVEAGGLQHYVYRLTITAGPYLDWCYPLGGRRGETVRVSLGGQNVPPDPVEFKLPGDTGTSFTTSFRAGDVASNPVTLEVSDLTEVLENAEASSPTNFTLPAVLNGRIAKPGEVDAWAFAATKDASYEFDLRSARLGTPLDSVLTVHDAAGKELARADDLPNKSPDSQLVFRAPADGTYTVRVQDRFASRGGPAFGYRLHATTAPAADFHLRLSLDTLSVNRGAEAKLKVTAERLGGFAEEIRLELAPLPAGVTVSPLVIAKGKNDVDLVFKAEANAPVTALPVLVRGLATIAEKEVARPATVRILGEHGLDAEGVFLAVSVPTPFKVKGVFETKYAPRGSTFVRHYVLERNGFEGPLTVRLGDRQARHLQGVSGPTITVPPDAAEFNYPVYLPPWMEIGRTSRSVVMAVGEVADADGTRHKVSFTSLNQNEQIVILVNPGSLSVEPVRRSIEAKPGSEVVVPIRVGRGTELKAPVKVELIVPAHIQGVSADPVTVAGDQTTGELRLKFATGSHGPFNMPLTLRAASVPAEGSPVVAESPLEVVLP